MFSFWRFQKPKSQKRSTPNTNSKLNGICDEQFSIKMHWEIHNYLVCRHNLEIHFDFHFSITRSVWWSCRHYRLARFYTVTPSSFDKNFQSWFDFSLFTFFHFDKIYPTDWRSGDCLTLSRLTGLHKQSQFHQFFASVASAF